MTWNFNFCSPHLNDDDVVNLNRTFLVVQLLIAAIITFIVHMLAQLYDEESNKVKNEADPPENKEVQQDKQLQDSAIEFHKNIGRGEMETYELTKFGKTNQSTVLGKGQPGFFKKNKIFFLSVETVENKAPCFFGHFSIVVAACIMYSPFTYQSIMGLVYIIAVILMLVFEAWKYPRSLTISVGISYIMVLGMAVSATVGVGLSNWDDFSISCYYTSLTM